MTTRRPFAGGGTWVPKCTCPLAMSTCPMILSLCRAQRLHLISTLTMRLVRIIRNFSLKKLSMKMGSLFGSCKLKNTHTKARDIVNTYFCAFSSRTDTSFLLPKVELYVRFTSAISISSPKAAACHDMMACLLADALTEEVYMASMAELQGFVKGSDASLTVRVSGFSDKAPTLLRKMVEALVAPRAYVTEQAFLRQREVLGRKYANDGSKASSAAKIARLVTLKPSKHPSLSKLACLLPHRAMPKAIEADIGAGIEGGQGVNEGGMDLGSVRNEMNGDVDRDVGEDIGVPVPVPVEGISREEVLAFALEFLSSPCVDVFAHGNVTTADSRAIGEMAKAALRNAAELNEWRRVQSLPLSPCGPGGPEKGKAQKEEMPMGGGSGCVGGMGGDGGLGAGTGAGARAVLSSRAFPVQPIVRLPSGVPLVVAVTPRNSLERNVCVEMYFQLQHEYSPSSSSATASELRRTVGSDAFGCAEIDLVAMTKMDLLEQLLTEPFFDDLRTKQQVK